MIGLKKRVPKPPRLLTVKLAPHLLQTQPPAARLLGQRHREFDDALAVRVADHWNQQPAISVDGDADVVVALVDGLQRLHVRAGVQLRERLQPGGDDLDHERAS